MIAAAAIPGDHNKPLADRVALVTGGGSGIGRAIALALARRGAKLALVGRRREPLHATVAAIQQLEGEALAIAADLTQPTSHVALLAQIHEYYGPVDILVNNAACLNNGAFSAQSVELVGATVATNLTAPIALTQCCLPDLIARRGKIVLIGSTTSFVPLPYLTLYSATKAGLHAFGVALRHEVTPLGVQLLLAYPPATATAMTAPMAARQAQKGRHTRYRLANPESIGERIVSDLLAGKHATIWWSGEHLLRLVYRVTPWFVEWILARQHQRVAAALGKDDIHDRS